jgi:exoribonuclease R
MSDGIAAIQAEQKVSPSFPDAVEKAAADAAANPRLPELDRTDIELVTIDPEGAKDLDQAMHIERDPQKAGGYVVHYAIADVTAFVSPGDPVDAEANRRGETLYGANSKIPLHPPVLSEDAASLLPDQVRPALLWTIKVDDTGEGLDVQVERALVRSRAQLTYEAVQADIDAGRGSELMGLLQEVGELRLAREAARGGVSLPLPEQELVEEDGHWELEFRRLTPVETWNAQISLLTGMAAASLMVYARVGILRTLPPADPRDVQRLHRTARALGIDWPAEQLYPDFIRTLDPSKPTHATMVVACTRLLRGAGYVTFNGELPEQAQHAALASEYAHVTAPLRRLVDRYAGEICVALCAGTDVPDWVVAAMGALPDTMSASGRRANQYENAVVDLCEAELLKDRVGESFTAVVVEVDEKDPTRGDVTIQDPAIEATVAGSADLPLGGEVQVRLAQADPKTRKVSFELA